MPQPGSLTSLPHHREGNKKSQIKRHTINELDVRDMDAPIFVFRGSVLHYWVTTITIAESVPIPLVVDYYLYNNIVLSMLYAEICPKVRRHNTLLLWMFLVILKNEICLKCVESIKIVKSYSFEFKKYLISTITMTCQIFNSQTWNWPLFWQTTESSLKKNV